MPSSRPPHRRTHAIAPASAGHTHGSNTSYWTGGYVEPYAFGGISKGSRLDPDAGPGLLQDVDAPAHTMSVSRASGIASMAICSILASRSEPPREVWKGVPRVNVFPITPAPAEVEQTLDGNAEMMAGDGGLLEITGIISLLHRRVENILVMGMTSDKTIEEDASLASLFGSTSVPLSGDSFDFSHNQVFATDRYSEVIATIRAEMEAGRAAKAQLNLVTVDNPYWGVRAGQRVRVCWIYLHAPTAWIDRLPEDTRAELFNGTTFESFPHYSTTKQFQLTYPQANLLAHMTSAVVIDNAQAIRSALGLVSDPTPTPTVTPSGHGDNRMSSAWMIMGVMLGLAAAVGIGCIWHQRGRAWLQKRFKTEAEMGTSGADAGAARARSYVLAP